MGKTTEKSDKKKNFSALHLVFVHKCTQLESSSKYITYKQYIIELRILWNTLPASVVMAFKKTFKFYKIAKLKYS